MGGPKTLDTKTYKACKLHGEHTESAGEWKKNTMLLLILAFYSLNLGVDAQPWCRNSLNLDVIYQSWRREKSHPLACKYGTTDKGNGTSKVSRTWEHFLIQKALSWTAFSSKDSWWKRFFPGTKRTSDTKKRTSWKGKSGQFLEQKRTGEQENLCNFPAMQYSPTCEIAFLGGWQLSLKDWQIARLAILRQARTIEPFHRSNQFSHPSSRFKLIEVKS
jgi:hypothetical protein